MVFELKNDNVSEVLQSFLTSLSLCSVFVKKW